MERKKKQLLCTSGPRTPVSAWSHVDPTSYGGPRHQPHRIQVDQVQSAGSLRRHKLSPLIPPHQSKGMDIQAPRPVLPYLSYDSLTKVSTVDPATRPASALCYREMLREGLHSINTSTELMKVLNHIWVLEEKHASSKSQVKELKMELKHARARIRELVYETQACVQEMDDKMKQIAEEKLTRKEKEQEKFKTAIQSIRKELEDERKVRRKSETLHCKLEKEVSDVKGALSNAVAYLEREKEAKAFVESVCDALAEGVGNYESAVRRLQKKAGVEECHRADRWLDARLQMRIAQVQGDIAGKNTAIDRLHGEIINYLQARQSDSSRNNTTFDDTINLHAQSLESVHLNMDVEDDDSITSASELKLDNENGHGQLEASCRNGTDNFGKWKVSRIRRIVAGHNRKNISQNSSKVQVEQRNPLNTSKLSVGNKMNIMDKLHAINLHTNIEADNDEAVKTGGLNKSNQFMYNGMKTSNSDMHRVHCYNQCSENGRSSPLAENSVFAQFSVLSTPVLQRSYGVTLYTDISECSLKDSTLKEKLLKARLEGQRARRRI